MAPGASATFMRRWAARRNAEAARARLAPSSTKRLKGNSPPSRQTESGKRRKESPHADAKFVEQLNLVVKSKLTGIDRYWLRYRIHDNWGYKLSPRLGAISSSKPQHATNW